MNQRQYLLKGTFILTFTGILTRAAGFLYKIFLSRTIGAAQIGLFQLTLPVCAFCTALSCGGVQTAVSRFTAEYRAQRKDRAALRILVSALLLSGGVSLLCAAAMLSGSSWIARSFLLEPACTPLLQMTALSIPFSAIHGCVSGYFIGRKNVAVTAGAQFIEQLLRIVSVLFVFTLLRKGGSAMDASVMALGQVAGEFSAALFCVCHLLFGKNAPSGEAEASRPSQTHSARICTDKRSARCVMPDRAQTRSVHMRTDKSRPLLPGRDDFRRTLSVSLPLGLNRTLMCVLQGIEAALLPQMLRRFGYDSAQALAVYGTLTGMALPLILFPTAITGALGTLLLPAVSEAQALHQDKKITGAIDASFQGSLLLGLFFLCAFLLFGGSVGELLFHNRLAGEYARKLALLCPFLYLNTTLASILHGIGVTTLVTAWNIVGFGIRLSAILLFVPGVGIDGYFLGVLLSQGFLTACSLFLLHRSCGFRTDLTSAFIRPALICMASCSGALLSKNALPFLGRTSWGSLFCLGIIYTAAFLALSLFLAPENPVRRKLLPYSTRM